MAWELEIAVVLVVGIVVVPEVGIVVGLEAEIVADKERAVVGMVVEMGVEENLVDHTHSVVVGMETWQAEEGNHLLAVAEMETHLEQDMPVQRSVVGCR